MCLYTSGLNISRNMIDIMMITEHRFQSTLLNTLSIRASKFPWLRPRGVIDHLMIVRLTLQGHQTELSTTEGISVSPSINRRIRLPRFDLPWSLARDRLRRDPMHQSSRVFV